MSSGFWLAAHRSASTFGAFALGVRQPPHPSPTPRSSQRTVHTYPFRRWARTAHAHLAAFGKTGERLDRPVAPTHLVAVYRICYHSATTLSRSSPIQRGLDHQGPCP